VVDAINRTRKSTVHAGEPETAEKRQDAASDPPATCRAESFASALNIACRRSDRHTNEPGDEQSRRRAVVASYGVSAAV
jgi:hypothetical protein